MNANEQLYLDAAKYLREKNIPVNDGWVRDVDLHFNHWQYTIKADVTAEEYEAVRSSISAQYPTFDYLLHYVDGVMTGEIMERTR